MSYTTSSHLLSSYLQQLQSFLPSPHDAAPPLLMTSSFSEEAEEEEPEEDEEELVVVVVVRGSSRRRVRRIPSLPTQQPGGRPK